MSEDEQLKVVIEQTISKAIATIPSYLQEIEENKDILKVTEQKEFVYGLIIGMALSMAVASLTSIKKGMPTSEDQLKIRDMVYSKIPEIRKEIFK
ncbi:MAG: hypothetical protein NPMRTHETA2_2840006 [Nitrosopumilales archaeon]|nr:MAG: hypothetical protein NPMRTHETA2_2840006 [Nitrosopumilales archaeon]